MKKGFTLIELMVVVSVIGLLASITLPRFGDSTSAAKAAQVHSNLYNIQQAIDMFYAVEGRYPEYGKDIGAGDGGNTFSDTFERYYSKGRMPETPAGGQEVSKARADRERVYEWGNDQLAGGWLYNEERGKLYARLVYSAYEQGNEWVPEDEFKDSLVSEKVFEDIALSKNEKWFTSNFLDEFTFETAFKINGGGRMEIFLDVDLGEALSEVGVKGIEPTGYMLRIHPIRGEMYLLKVNEYENIGDGGGKSPNTKNGKEEVIERIDLKNLNPPIPNSVWQKNEVPISVDVKNTGNNSKSLSMSIGGQQIKFENGDTVEYPSTNQKTTVGVGTSKGRTMEVAEVVIKNK